MGLFDRPQKIGTFEAGADSARIAALEERVAALEAQVAALTRPSAPQPGEEASGMAADAWAEIRALKVQGRPIEAIKLARERFGLSLKDAKNAVDGL